jgi:hypothetical protein
MIPESAPYLMLAIPPMLAFGRVVKDKVRQKTGQICEDCGVKDYRGELHHIVKQEFGGADTEDNAVFLCGPYFNDCHEKWDWMADKGIIFPGYNLQDAPKELFKGGKLKESAIRKLTRRGVIYERENDSGLPDREQKRKRKAKAGRRSRR